MSYKAPGLGRLARGYKLHYCGQCRRGVTPGATRTFDPKCAGCGDKVERYKMILMCDCWQHLEESESYGPHEACAKCKELRALGIRYGTEPMPVKGPAALHRKRLSDEDQAKFTARITKAHTAMKAARVSPFPRFA